MDDRAPSGVNPGAHFMAAVAVCFVAFLLFQSSGEQRVLLWAAYLLACEAILGMIMLSRLRGQDWLRAYTLMHLVACAGWGLLPLIFLLRLESVYQMFYVLVLGTAAVVTQPTLSYMPRLYLGGMLLMLTPVAIGLMMGSDVASDDVLMTRAMAVFMVLAILLLTIRLRQNYSMLLARAEEALSLEEAHNTIQIHQQILENEQQRAEQAGKWDPVTGVRSQRGFLEELGIREAKPGSVGICVKIAGFKFVNMAFGHDTGDEVLRELAARLAALAGTPEQVCRTGGGEFLALIEDPPANLEKRLSRLCETPCMTSKGPVMINAFIGIDSVQGGGDIQQAVHGALHAAEDAKLAGDMRIRHLAHDAREEQRSRSRMRFALREALDKHEFHIVYQPQHRLSDHTLTGFEALLRWQSAEFGAVSPADFISIAEEAGLITELGAWVCENAMREFQQHFKEKGLSLSLNVSLAQFEAEGFVDMIRDKLERYQIPPQQLTLEITESIFMSAPQIVSRQLSALRDIGVRVALDDFGTGYSSLSYLARIPLDEVKIDRSFVSELTSSQIARTLVTSVLQICQALGVQAVLEGVEESAQADSIRNFPETIIQGFLYSRPLSITSAASYASRSQPLGQNTPE